MLHFSTREFTTLKGITMSTKDKLKCAILGLGDPITEIIDAAAETGLYEIIALADTDVYRAQKACRKYEAENFDDFRQLVVRNPLDVLFVGGPDYVCDEYIRTAMNSGINIIKPAPPGIDFEQTAEYVRTARRNKIRFFTAIPERYGRIFEYLREYATKEKRDSFELINIVCSMCRRPGDPSERWLSDPKLAGGGVLLRNCYEIIDRLLCLFPLPQQVYSLNTNQAPDRQQRLSITEDIAVVTLKFSDVLMANLTASRTFGPDERFMKLYNRRKFIEVRPNYICEFDSEGNLLEKTDYQDDRKYGVRNMLEIFAGIIRGDFGSGLLFDEAADLRAMAVIESAYLSARTSMPEDPSKIISLSGLTGLESQTNIQV